MLRVSGKFGSFHTVYTQTLPDSSSPILDLCARIFQLYPGPVFVDNCLQTFYHLRLFLLQSAQLLLPSSLSRVLIVC